MTSVRKKLNPVRGRGHFRDKIKYSKDAISLSNKEQALKHARPRPASNGIKVLIGTPVHITKDYCMERWLKSVSELEYPADLLLVDNSPGLGYVKKLHNYCKKCKLNLVENFGKGPIPKGKKNYKIKHLEILQGKKSGKTIGEQTHERLALSREIIREDFLASDYDVYFYWESDILIPPDSLSKLIQLMQLGNFMVVTHNCWISTNPNHVNFDYGIAIFSRKCMKKYSWFLEGTDPEMPDNWYESEAWFRKRLHKDKNNYAQVIGLIEPVLHLAK